MTFSFHLFLTESTQLELEGCFPFWPLLIQFTRLESEGNKKREKKRRNTPSDDLIASALLWMPDRYCIYVFFWKKASTGTTTYNGHFLQ
jgi:hypothetical protein